MWNVPLKPVTVTGVTVSVLCGSAVQHLVGLWIALVIGYGMTTMISITAVLRSKWADLAAKAMARSETASVASAVMIDSDEAASLLLFGQSSESTASASHDAPV